MKNVFISTVSQDSISVGDVHGREIYEMTKYAIHKGIDKLDGHKKLGKIEFMVQTLLRFSFIIIKCTACYTCYT